MLLVLQGLVAAVKATLCAAWRHEQLLLLEVLLAAGGCCHRAKAEHALCVEGSGECARGLSCGWRAWR
jgi:hypothetical protein